MQGSFSPPWAGTWGEPAHLSDKYCRATTEVRATDSDGVKNLLPLQWFLLNLLFAELITRL